MKTKNSMPKIIVSTIFWLIITISSSFADEIVWMTADWPPYQYKEKGEFKGYGVELIRLIQSELPQHSYRFSQSNYARIVHKFQRKDNVCAFGFLKTPEREKFAYYSIWDMITLPALIHMRTDTFNALGSPQRLSIRALIREKNGILGIQKGVSWGPEIDKILTEFKGDPQIKELATSQITTNLFAMMLENRIDFVIDYPVEGRLTARKLGGAGKVKMVIIEEIKDEFIFTHTLCSKTEWGKKTINDINKALVKLRPTKKWQDSFGQYLDSYLRPLYYKKYKDVLDVVD